AETGGGASALVLSAAAVVAAVPVSTCRTGAAQAAAITVTSVRTPTRSIDPRVQVYASRKRLSMRGREKVGRTCRHTSVIEPPWPAAGARPGTAASTAARVFSAAKGRMGAASG